MSKNKTSKRKIIINLSIDNLPLLLQKLLDVLITWKSLALILLLLLIYNKNYITNSISHWNLQQFALAKEYLAIFISFPPLLFILALIFKNPIETFFENSKLGGLGPAIFDQANKQEIPTDNVKKEVEKENKAEDKTESNDSNLNDQLKQAELKAKLYEFAYLDKFLVPNTKYALSWLNLKPQPKEDFVNYYNLVSPVPNPVLEKETILNVLLTNKLIESDGNQNFTITEKGKDFLIFINSYPN